MARKKSSQRAMTAIGWQICPSCGGDERADCELCWDIEDKRFNRRVPVDVAIKWVQEHKTQIEVHDTEPEMPAVKPPKEEGEP